jgi:hypothetical protein
MIHVYIWMTLQTEEKPKLQIIKVYNAWVNSGMTGLTTAYRATSRFSLPCSAAPFAD